MPTESVDRDVNEDDTEETGGSYSVRNSEKAKVVFERMIERIKTEGMPNPLSCFNVPMKNLSMLDNANILPISILITSADFPMQASWRRKKLM